MKDGKVLVMKNIVIWGAGKNGIFLNKLFRYKWEIIQEKYNVLYFCDTYKKAGTFVDGIEIISPEQLKRIEHKIDKVVISSSLFSNEVQEKMLDVKLSVEVYTIPDYAFKFMWNCLNDNSNMPFFIKIDLDKPRLPYLEIKIVEHCNLNCRGCSVLANISEPKYMDLEEFESAMKRLKEIFWGIKDLKLFGGEPLLHQRLKEFISIARKYFPDSNLIVHSNGLLIPSMDKSLFQLMREKDARFEFTQYPPTGFKKRLIRQILEENGVEYKFRDALYDFQKIINITGNYHEEEVYKTCCKCINLIQGTLSCGMGWTLKGLEEKYGTVICEDKFQHCVDIFNTNLNGWEINKILDSPFNLCKYCGFMNLEDIDRRMTEWKCGGPFNLSDWIYDSNCLVDKEEIT